LGGAAIGKTIFTCVYIGKKTPPPEPESQFQSLLVQNSSLGKWDSELFKSRTSSSSKGISSQK
jgi:hypothetical protein